MGFWIEGSSEPNSAFRYLLCGQKVTQKPPAGIKWLNLRYVALNKINAPQLL